MSPPSLTFANRFLEERRKAACNRAFNNNNEAIKPRPCPCIRIRITQKGNEVVETRYVKISTLPLIASQMSRVSQIAKRRGGNPSNVSPRRIYFRRAYIHDDAPRPSNSFARASESVTSIGNRPIRAINIRAGG